MEKRIEFYERTETKNYLCSQEFMHIMPIAFPEVSNAVISSSV